MITWDDVYRLVVAMIPLYFALLLGYGSVKWWHLFTPEQCDAINTLNYYFITPLFTFEFTSNVNPYAWNYPFIGADVISKSIILVVLVFWANCASKGSFSWSITSFSMATLNNTLVVGVPLLKAVYGQMGADLVVQSSVLQSILWFMTVLFMHELRRQREEFGSNPAVADDSQVPPVEMVKDLELGRQMPEFSSNPALDHDSLVPSVEMAKDLEGSRVVVKSTKPSFWLLMKMVWIKLARNPNSYACVVGLAWSCISNRWHIQMPSIVHGPILILSKAGSGIAMFCMGLFMALQAKLITCGAGLTLLGMALRFIVGPVAMAAGCFVVGLRGDVLRVAIIQAALPQSITSFVYAKEYEVHANVLSTAVIFGTIVSLPVLIAYYATLDLVH
ncbi:hypothetical protein RJ639_015502 [Escallonia herrerae]|uniref:Auxin efflux carrier component n=1 Tax=Escallonia herrerae TaxID=1293975 RepID=A0AA88VFI0_9ASTE|nr:hypothetical protein RJ639_015502 [Escallonia herrerae]